METPPPYYSNAPKKSNTGLIVGIVIGVALLCCVLPIAGLGGLGLWGMQKVKGVAGCTFTMSDVAYALKAYAKSHDGKLPNAETWQNDIKSYYQQATERADQRGNPFPPSPTDGPWGCSDDSGGSTGIAFNSDLSGKKVDDIKSPSDTIVVFEVAKQGMNLHQVYKPQPFEESPTTFGKHRGWYTVKANWNLTMGSRDKLGNNADVNVNINSQGND